MTKQQFNEIDEVPSFIAAPLEGDSDNVDPMFSRLVEIENKCRDLGRGVIGWFDNWIVVVLTGVLLVLWLVFFTACCWGRSENTGKRPSPDLYRRSRHNGWDGCAQCNTDTG